MFTQEPEPEPFYVAVFRWLEPRDCSYQLTRKWFLRALGFIYFIAYLSFNRQVLGLFGSDGLLPARLFLDYVTAELDGSIAHRFFQLPSIFWWNCSDVFLLSCSYAGLALSLLMMAGATNAILMFAQWLLYLSIVHIGQVFYGYGWETMLLEAGFLAIFLCPVRSIRPNATYQTPKVVIWFYRWLLFRLMLGAGLIKIRGDECWRDLTCLFYHYETQPLPNPISWYLHGMPPWVHQAGVLFNHFSELIVPWFYFAPRKIRHTAGVITILFQVLLIVSGNLSFLNWLTIVIAIPCFDDSAISWVLRVKRAAAAVPLPRVSRVVLSMLTILLLLLSVDPVRNMMSSQQMMNASFDQLHILNTYGAFGVVGRVRNEIIIEGTSAEIPDDSAEWKAYEFVAKPGAPMRRPPFIAPYQSRIDWQIWFAAMQDYRSNPWLIHLIYKLLKNDRLAVGLLQYNPFPNSPPRYIRADLYEYHFTKDRSAGAWWERKKIGSYLPPVSAEDPDLKRYIAAHDWPLL